ncbi:hypothetical protein M5K25_027815 [Dendrobium thyrsiflorum]|uniref:Uncharacterized protein n=1 Tax=Dendrobium thyrsiflorum TaxID=117978 RepID=A0ABD0TUS4_DENTH
MVRQWSGRMSGIRWRTGRTSGLKQKCQALSRPSGLKQNAFPWYGTGGIPCQDLGAHTKQEPPVPFPSCLTFCHLEAISRDYHPSRDHAAENSSARRPHKGVTLDDGASSVTSDSLIVFHKKFHFPNNLVATIPKRSDRACLPPLGYIVIYVTHLRTGLRFPPPPELIDITERCRVRLPQFSYRATSVTIGLIAFFRDRGVVLTPKCLLRVGRFTSDGQGRSWASAFFFVKNDWGLIEKWGKLNDLPAPLHVIEEDIMRIRKVLDIEHLLYEVRYLDKYIEEELMFKVGLSFHVGRSEARMLKKSSKVPELPVPVPKVAPKRQLLQWKDLEAELTHSLNEWNNEFVKIKYLQGEYKRKYDSRTKEVKQLDWLQIDFKGAQAVITQLQKDQKASVEKVAALEAENKRSQTLLAEKEDALSDSRV